MNSPVFADDWFGAATPPSDDHSIASGYWATVTTPDGSAYAESWDIASTGSLNPFTNGYSDFRSPWNNNPSSHICRVNTTYGASADFGLVACSAMSDCYSSTSLSDVSYLSYLFCSVACSLFEIACLLLLVCCLMCR